MKKILVVLLFLFIMPHFTFADESNGRIQNLPPINGEGLPGSVDASGQLMGADLGSGSESIAEGFVRNTTNILVDVVAVLAVFSLIFSGIYYIISGGEEEKVTKAKKWMLWSLGAVILATFSWGIVDFLNNISIN